MKRDFHNRSDHTTPKRNIDIAYSLTGLCNTIINVYHNCGNDCNAFCERRYCDEVDLFTHTLVEINAMLKLFTPEIAKQHKDSILPLASDIEELFEHEGFTIGLLWEKIKLHTNNLKSLCVKMVDSYKVYIQYCFSDDLTEVQLISRGEADAVY